MEGGKEDWARQAKLDAARRESIARREKSRRAEEGRKKAAARRVEEARQRAREVRAQLVQAGHLARGETRPGPRAGPVPRGRPHPRSLSVPTF